VIKPLATIIKWARAPRLILGGKALNPKQEQAQNVPAHSSSIGSDRWGAGAPGLFSRISLASGLETQGCCLRADQRESAATKLVGSLQRSSSGVITSSANPNLNRYLGRALLRLANYFDVYPGFGFFDDRGAADALATSYTLLPGTRGTVLFGLDLFRECMRDANDQGLTVIALCAHEFAHVLQFETTYHADLMSGQKNVKLVELHADYLAGFFLADRKREHPTLPLQDVGRTFEKIGDTSFGHRGHHGTPEERIAAVEAGHFQGKNRPNSTVMRAAELGAAFVRRFA
jgi:hypothetical protein